VAHVGLHALGSFADRLGLGDALSSVIPWQGRGVPLHDRGKVLAGSALMLAGGGESCLDIEHLRTGDDLFGPVPSDATLARTLHEITPSVRTGIAGALADVRSEVRYRSQAGAGDGPVGFHPMFCFAEATGETLAALLRLGNAGANTVADHLVVLDAGLAQLPPEVALGHRPGDIGFFVSARSNAQVSAAIFDAIGMDEVWLPARTPPVGTRSSLRAPRRASGDSRPPQQRRSPPPLPSVSPDATRRAHAAGSTAPAVIANGRVKRLG
jgi:hypothetical protein